MNNNQNREKGERKDCREEKRKEKKENQKQKINKRLKSMSVENFFSSLFLKNKSPKSAEQGKKTPSS